MRREPTTRPSIRPRAGASAHRIRIASAAAILAGCLAHQPALAQSGETDGAPPGEKAIAELIVNGEPRGNVEFLLDARGAPLLDASLVRRALAGIARPELLAVVAGRERLVSSDELAPLGLRASFDPDALVLRLEVEPRARASVDLSGRGGRAPDAGSLVLEPEGLAAELAVSADFDPQIRSQAEGSSFSPRGGLVLAPSVNFLDCVAEGSLSLSYDGGCLARLNEARVSRDFPAHGARLVGGIVDARAVSFQSAKRLLGLSFYREASLPGGASLTEPLVEELVLEDSADVSIIVNGITARRLRLEAGSYSISDLPLASGLNEVLVEIEETGKKPRAVKLGLPFDSSILKKGELDYGLSLGTDRDHPEKPFGAASFARGLGSSIQAGADAEAGFGSCLGGVSALWATGLGNIGAAAAFSAPYESDSTLVPAFGSRLSWRLSIPSLRYLPRIGLAAEYRGKGFTPPRVDDSSSTDDLSATWILSGQASETLPRGAGSLFAFADARLSAGGLARASLSAGAFVPIRRMASFSLSGGTDWSAAEGFSPNASLSFTIATSDRRSLYERFDALRLSDSFGLSASLDKAGRTIVSAHGAGLGGAGLEREFGISGSSYAGPVDLSAELSYEQSADSSSRTFGGGVSASTDIAYAGGRLMAARDLGEAFAILVPKASCLGEKIVLRSAGGRTTTSEGGKPAIVAGIVPYDAYAATVEMPASPPDRRAAPASVALYPSYRSGTIIEIGSSAPIAVRGRLVDAEGNPRALLSGQGRGLGLVEAPAYGTFSDEDGLFECYGLEPGAQEIAWDDGSSSRFTVAEPSEAEASAIIELGDIRATDPEPRGEGSVGDE